MSLVKYLPGMHEVLGVGPSTIGREKKRERLGNGEILLMARDMKCLGLFYLLNIHVYVWSVTN